LPELRWWALHYSYLEDEIKMGRIYISITTTTTTTTTTTATDS
jgi:hypothetical protein